MLVHKYSLAVIAVVHADTARDLSNCVATVVHGILVAELDGYALLIIDEHCAVYRIIDASVCRQTSEQLLSAEHVEHFVKIAVHIFILHTHIAARGKSYIGAPYHAVELLTLVEYDYVIVGYYRSCVIDTRDISCALQVIVKVYYFLKLVVEYAQLSGAR